MTEDRIVKLTGFEQALLTEANAVFATDQNKKGINTKPTDPAELNNTNEALAYYANNIEFQPTEIASGSDIGASTDIW